MIETARPNILFVINPKSGKERKDYKTLIQQALSTSQFIIHYFLLGGTNDFNGLDKAIAHSKPAIVAAVGGDGTVSMVAKKILGTEIKLGIIPAGSANGMAKELSISERLEDALSVLLNGTTKKIDVLTINNLICLHLSDMGLNARLIKYFESGTVRGRWGYVKVALKIFFRKQSMQVTIRIKDEEIKKNALMVVVANASKYGTGAIVNPHGDLSDGLFELVIMKQMGLITLLKMWLQPGGLSPHHTEVIQADKAYIQTRKKMPFQVDGEYIGKVQSMNVSIHPHQLNIIVPTEL